MLTREITSAGGVCVPRDASVCHRFFSVYPSDEHVSLSAIQHKVDCLGQSKSVSHDAANVVRTV